MNPFETSARRILIARNTARPPSSTEPNPLCARSWAKCLPFRTRALCLALPLALASFGLAAETPAGTPRESAAVLTPEHQLSNPSSDPAWRGLFTALSQPKNRFSRFEERRYFPFREQPVVLHGEIRIIPDRGLSLSYAGPKAHVIIIDQQGVLMRDERGRERSAPEDGRARAVTSALSHILKFDLAALEKEFVIHGLRDGDAWTLGFAPRDEALAGLLGTLIVHGRQTALDRIEMIKSDQQRIEILITSTESDVIFPMDVLKRFFR